LGSSYKESALVAAQQHYAKYIACNRHMGNV